MDESPAPLLIYPPDLPTWSMAQAAALMAGPALTAAQAETQLRRYQRLGLIHGSGPLDNNGARGLPAEAVLAGRVLSVLNTDIGLSDAELSDCASRGLYTWDKHQPPALLPGADGKPLLGRNGKPQRPSPVMAAAMGAARGEVWVFHLTVFRAARLPGRVARAWTYNPEDWHPLARIEMGGELMPLSTITINLPALLLPLYHRLAADLERIGAAALRVH